MKLDHKGRAYPAHENKLSPSLPSYASNHHGNWHHRSLSTHWDSYSFWENWGHQVRVLNSGVLALSSHARHSSCFPHCSLRGWGVSVQSQPPTCVFDLQFSCLFQEATPSVIFPSLGSSPLPFHWLLLSCLKYSQASHIQNQNLLMYFSSFCPNPPSPLLI